jgi:serine/threonine-protein kinase
MPHDAAETVCPTTGRRIPTPEAPRSRMSEIPPPERKPKPLGFDPSHQSQRINRPQRPTHESISMPETRNLQRDLIGQTIGNRYQVRDVLGEGGMGTVYEALHLGLGRPVAIKILNPSQAKKRVAVKRFQQEARAAGAIGHPNICEVYDMGLLDDASPYLVMEKLVGTTLADRIAREGGLPFDEIVDVMIQVLSGLIAAHDKGIVHRDIKPENVFLARRVGCPPIVKILDFGVSKMMPQFQNADEQLDLTRTGMVMGTPYYMSPEQARGERNLDGRVDVYACGVMMYESLVGKRPYLAPNYNALLLAIINTTPRSIREIRPATPAQLEQVVGRAMAKARDDRYPSALHFLRDIQALQLSRSNTTTAHMPPPPPTPEERARAQVVGGRRGRDEVPPSSIPNRIQSIQTAVEAGATLRSRMAEARGQQLPPPRQQTQPHVESGELATRLDVQKRQMQHQQQPPPSNRYPPPSDSIDIPIHVTGTTPSLGSELGDEMPTEIFRPGMHPRPAPPPPRSGSGPTQIQRPRAAAPSDWDHQQTAIHRPEMPVAHPGRPHPSYNPTPTKPFNPRPFNPDETIRLDSDRPPPEEMDFSDETKIAPPRKRPQR